MCSEQVFESMCHTLLSNHKTGPDIGSGMCFSSYSWAWHLVDTELLPQRKTKGKKERDPLQKKKKKNPQTSHKGEH